MPQLGPQFGPEPGGAPAFALGAGGLQPLALTGSLEY